jgi:hypothetical protein
MEIYLEMGLKEVDARKWTGLNTDFWWNLLYGVTKMICIKKE